ncbi:hypothetical protein [Terribacillus aidingensis]|nr:hypothetical protein [Terribacillus aidingensis]
MVPIGDQIISEELKSGKEKKELKELLQYKMNESIRQRIIE